MKKLIAGLFAAILTTAGLVAVSSAPAQAGCKPGYACTPTSSTVKPVSKAIRAGKPAKVKITVKTRGTVQVKGTLTVKVKGPGGFTKTIKVKVNKSKNFTVKLGKLKKAGKYKVTTTFVGADGFRDSKGKATITVKKKNKKK